MQIDWFAFGLWMGFLLTGLIVGGMFGYIKGKVDGAQNYPLIVGYLRKTLDSREDADAELESIRTTINAIKEGSE